ncbi:uncharacterized protein [Euwallacea fornicatus]|uniref:uncharacterized protein n=1 Tax=Euwallacea fornicatus TaxID=995702 RepID=UPI00338DC308
MGVSDYMFVCLLSALPGPPSVVLDGANLQLYPLNKNKCSHVDPVRDISFQLYTRHNPLSPAPLRIDDDAALANSHFNFSEPTIFFFHAFFESYQLVPATYIRTAYTQRGDHNIILLNAPRLEAGPWYLTAAQNTRVVGEYAAQFVDYMVSRGLYLPSLHLAGLSLGAHMAGVCGSNVKSGRIRRITGMDPAGPLFTKWPKSLKLDASDAEFVDVIHTDAGIFGYPNQIGHVDFWPNKGIAPQPGCNLNEVKKRNPDALMEYAFCSHWRSYQFFAESVVNPRAFLGAVNCNNWGDYANGVCSEENSFTSPMGLYVDPSIAIVDMSASVSVFCLLTNLPGPPLVHWQNFSLQLWSVNRRLCPKIDPYRDTIFHLYTRNNPDESKILIPDDDESLIASGIDFFYNTIIFFHGFLESHLADDAQSIKNAYLQEGTYNVILVQNERLIAGPDYFTAAKNCRPIGQYSANFIDFLVTKGLKLQNLHVIGLSLGGQIAGMTGQYVKSGKLPRITALDPAGPLFNGNPIDERLDPTDADFVDVIYTNSGVFGMKYAVGHANFWPNGGTKQPGCTIPEVISRYGIALNWLVFCNHFRSYQLYTESILSPKSMPAKKCKSNVFFKLGKCRNNDIAYLGYLAEPRNQGDYYLDTGYTGIYVG